MLTGHLARGCRAGFYGVTGLSLLFTPFVVFVMLLAFSQRD
jgi:hypothetical protein